MAVSPLNPNEPTLIAETSEWLAIAKPAGWLTIPGRGEAMREVPVLSEWLEKRVGTVFTVHRLDLETSGLILFAKTAQAHAQANAWFAGRETKKIYQFVAHGIPKLPLYKVKLPIEGQSATTQIEPKSMASIGFFGEAFPHTGRRHQIRIHLASLGHPIWGDKRYGGKKEIESAQGPVTISRVALHAKSLRLPSGETFEAPLPKDFQSWVDLIAAGAK